MSVIRKFSSKLSRFQKVTYLVFILSLLLLSIVGTALSNYTGEKTVNNIFVGLGDITEPVAKIKVGSSSWNNLRYTLNTSKFDSNIVFDITTIDELTPLQEAFKQVDYYLSNSNVPLTDEQITQIESWTGYTSSVQINTQGTYIIYVRIIDNENKVGYLNSDVLVLDWAGPTVNVNLDTNIWSNLRDNLNFLYIDREKTITVEASDNVSGIASIKYHITDQILSSTDLEQLNNESWTDYSEGILINNIGKHIVYVQIIDNNDNTTYVNTDYIVLDGYTESMIVGRSPSSYLEADPYITSKSTITFDISYSNTSANQLTNHTHNLKSNIMLAVGTKLTLIDHITEKVYKFIVTTESDTYPLTLFNEVGRGATEVFFTESDYYNEGTINEHFTVVLDLSNTNISTNHNNVILYMELNDSSAVNVRPTLYNTIDTFNIYSNVNEENANASLSLTTDYSGAGILFNSNSNTDINLTSSLTYKSINDFKIIDTTYEDKEVGISIKLVDSEGNTVSREYLKNISFKMGNSIYHPEQDNIVHVSLNSGIVDTTKTLTIITGDNNIGLAAGTYYFKISSYASYDGYYYGELNSNELSIPLTVTEDKTDIPYGFNVTMDDASRIIEKNNTEANVSFLILLNGELENPNIRVSLYKKDQLTAYDQNYSIVNLADYVTDELQPCDDNVYYVSTSPIKYAEPDYLYNEFQLNFNTTNLENTGYKFVFDLYDGTEKVGTIEKYFIVKWEDDGNEI